MYHSSKISKAGFDMIAKFLKFPTDKSLPGLDLYRMLLMHPNLSEHYKLVENGIEYVGNFLSFLNSDIANI